MKISRRIGTFSAISILIMPSYSLASSLLFDTLTAPPITGEIMNASLPSWGQSFVTSNSIAYFDNVALDIEFGRGTGDLVVGLYSSSGSIDGSLPANAIVTLNGSRSPNNSSPALYIYTPSSPIALDANTAYWVVATDVGENPSNPGYAWLQARGAPSVGSHIGTELIGRVFMEGDVPTFNEPLMMAVNYAVVPEPEAWTMILCGVIALGASLRCSRRDQIRGAIS